MAGLDAPARNHRAPTPPAASHGRPPGNPLGARALYIGVYRIHGTNAPERICQAVSSGCLRLVNDDIIDVYERVLVWHTGRRAPSVTADYWYPARNCKLCDVNARGAVSAQPSPRGRRRLYAQLGIARLQITVSG
jgi:L,D-transpeptidase catalytic domain